MGELRRTVPPRRPGAGVKLTVAWGDTPEVGSELRTPSGRRYLVTRIGGKKTLHCVVLGKDSPPGDPVLAWTWAARKKRREP